MNVSYRAVLELYEKNTKQARIAKQLFTTPKTVKRITDKALAAGLIPEKWKEYTDEQLSRLLNPRPNAIREFYPESWKSVHEDLARRSTSSSKKNHLTLQWCYEEYCARALNNNAEPMSRSKYYDEYAIWWKKNDSSSNIQWPAGRRMEIDFAGDLLYYVDPETDKQVTVVLFVCTLSHSRFTYVEGIPSQEKRYFVNGVIHACQYYGATAHLWIPDCTKAAVIKGSKTDWAILNNTMQDLSEIYHVETQPCNPYTPKGIHGKGAVEASVNNSYQRIYNAIRNITFHSLEDLNDALWKAMEKFNDRPITGKPEWTRRKAYLETEKKFMLPLPSENFELRQTTTAKAGKHYVFCSIDRYYYSIPHDLKEKQVMLKLGMKDLIITTMSNQVIAVHQRGTDLWDNHVTIPEHLESYLRVYSEESPSNYIEMAEKKAGYSTRIVVENIFATSKFPETVYQYVNAVLQLGKKYGYTTLDKACSYALKRFGTNPEARIGYSKLKPICIDLKKKEQEQKLRDLYAVPEESINMDEYEV